MIAGAPPSFIYVLPMSETEVFLEETILISDAPVAFSAYDFSGGMVAANDAARRAAGDAAEERVVACSDAEVARVLSDPAMMASVILLSLCCPPSTLRVQVQRHFRSRVRAAVS